MQECNIKNKVIFLVSDSAFFERQKGVFNTVLGNINFTGNAVMFYTVGEVGISFQPVCPFFPYINFI